jgi:HEAT repeat protein
VRLGTPDAKERARAALGDPDGGVRATAVTCLLDLRDAEAVPLLVRVALEDADWRARRGAVEAVGTLAAKGSAGEIAGALDDVSSQVRLAAIGAVMRLGPASAVEMLARFSARESSWEVRAAATEALGRTSSSDAYAPGKAALSDANEFVRAAAAAALRELRRSGVPEPEEARPAEAVRAGPVLPGQRPLPPAAKPEAGARR